MKKKKILNLLLFAVAAFFTFTVLTNAACVLGAETTKDVKGALRIFRIIAPLALLAFTIIDGIKAVNSGGTFHMGDNGDMSTQKLVQRFVKRIVGILLLFALPALIDFLFVFIGIWDEGEGCDLSDPAPASTTTSDPYGCYSIAGGYAWGRQSEYGSIGMKVNNSYCGRDPYGGKYECYQCNSNGSIIKWKSNSDADADCPSAYHVKGGTQSSCHS